MDVSGNALFRNNISVSGTASFSNNVSVSGTASFGNNISVTGTGSYTTQVTAPTFKSNGVMYSSHYLYSSTAAYTWNPAAQSVILAVSTGTITLPNNLATSGNNSQELLIYKIVAGNLVINCATANYIHYMPTNTRGNSFTVSATNARIACRWIPGYTTPTIGLYIVSVTS